MKKVPDQRVLIKVGKALQFRNQRFCLAQQPQRYRKLSRVPMYRFGLPPESIKSRLVEVSGGKAWFPSGREAPRTIIEAFAGHVDIVADRKSTRLNSSH